MRKSSLVLLALVMLVGATCLSGLTFAMGLGIGWYGRSQLASPSGIAELLPTLPHSWQVGKDARVPASSEQAETSGAAVPEVSAEAQLQVLTQAWNLIARDFYSESPVDYRQAAYGAIRGAIGALDDPHTSFAEPAQHEIDKSAYEGGFGGIGALIGTNEQGEPFVASTLEGQPAEAAGLLAGDVIVQVDGEPLTGLTQDQVVLLIRGPVGTTVVLTVSRDGRAAPLDVAIVRAEIKQTTVSCEPLEDGRVGYVQLTFFAEPTGAELAAALGEIRDLGISEIILDLRGNRGGLLSASGEVTSQFVREGVLLYERRHGPNGEVTEEAYMIPGSTPTYTDERLIVLVDGGTASAAEIVAGAIQDYERGILIGETTYGKGSMQYVHELSDGSSLHVTAAHWLTPQRRPINGLGLTPDVEVLLSEEDLQAGRDPQLERALEYLTQLRQVEE